MTDLTKTWEMKTCSRCGGSGNYSYCQMYGTTCFKCAGKGKVLTTRGAAAVEFLRNMRTIKVADVKPGMIVKPSGMKAFKVEAIEIRPDACKTLDSATGEWKSHTYICMKNAKPYGGLNAPADSTVQLVPATEADRKEQVQAALNYQATLTQAGKLRKREAA